MSSVEPAKLALVPCACLAFILMTLLNENIQKMVKAADLQMEFSRTGGI